METRSKTSEYRFVAEPFHVDFTGHLTLGTLGNHLLNCAGFHATERGFGIASLNRDNYTWVLSRLAIELDELPLQYEAFSISTWVENVYRLFTDRNFAILDKQGNPIGYARSVWAMINLNTRKPADLLALHGGALAAYMCDAPCPIDKPSRIRLKNPRYVGNHIVLYSDIDINGHVNSIRYIEHILDHFSLACFERNRISRFEIAYTAECYYGDRLTFYLEEVDDATTLIEVKRNHGDSVCCAKVTFTPRQPAASEPCHEPDRDDADPAPPGSGTL